MTDLFSLTSTIKNSEWWHKADQCVDRHYSNLSGVKLTHHLDAVNDNIANIYNNTSNQFLNDLFVFSDKLGLSQKQMQQELTIISLLHDIGKIEDDKLLYTIHPLSHQLVIKRHSIVSVIIAKNILEQEPSLTPEEKKRIYWAIEQHDISYGMYRQYLQTGYIPSFDEWKLINDNISDVNGAGLLYLLVFKLADIHGHANISDVIWFYRTVNERYYRHLDLFVPIPEEEDIR